MTTESSAGQQPAPPGLDQSAYIDAIHRNAAALARAARLGLDASVPSCPGWTVADLVTHIGIVHRNWSNQVRTRGQEPMELPDEEITVLPGLMPYLEKLEQGQSRANEAPPGLIEWFEQGAAELEDALRNVKPDEPIWSWSDNHTAAHHYRMQAIETMLHRWDAQLAHGTPDPMGEALARDGIDQNFDIMLPARRRWNVPSTGRGETYHFHLTDGEGEWFLRFMGDTVTVTREHAKGDVAVRGTAPDLFLFLWGRKPAEELEVMGDRALLDRYLELVPPA